MFLKVLTLQVVCYFAHELPVQPELYHGLAYSHWHANEGHQKISDWQVYQKVIGDTVTEERLYYTYILLMRKDACSDL